MSTPVRYYCPRCETVVAIDREGYLADKSVTPYPLEGWRYVDAEAFVAAEESGGTGEPGDPDADVESADGVRFVCGESAGVDWAGEGCGEPFYLSFVRFEAGVEVEPEPESERVTLSGPGPRAPRGPEGPQGPPGPG